MTTVLLLEDNPDMLKVLGMMLQESGYNVMSGRSAQEGLALLRQSRLLPDVIISDMVMPSEDGMSFLEHVRGTPEMASIPFILMSAYPSAQMQQQAFQLGADAFMSKPFQFEALNNTIRNLGLMTSAKV
jgi:CheY-like chemotaxis protein